MKKLILCLLSVASLFWMEAQTISQKAVAGQTMKVSCTKIDSILNFSKTKLGCKYKYSGIGPDVFDCSGFTMFVFRQFGIDLPHSSSDQYALGRKVKKEDIRPGDLLFFYRSKGIGHVAMAYSVDSANNVTFIHASTYKTGVKFDRLEGDHYGATFVGARRILECVDDSTYLLPYSDEEVVAVEKQLLPETPAPTTNSYYYHRIKHGETLSSIAQKYHTTVANIKSWNHLRSDKIKEGNSLKIYRQTPAKPSAPVVAAKPTSDSTAIVAKAATPVAAPSKVEKETLKPVAETMVPAENNLAPVDEDVVSPQSVQKQTVEPVVEPKKVETPVAKSAAVVVPVTEPEKVEAPAAEVKSAEPQVVYHTIAAGESLYGISRKYGVTVDQLQQWNHLASPDKIGMGDKLKIYTANAPKEEPSQTVSKPTSTTIIHVVKKGENMGRIAEKYHTTIEKILKWNNLTNPDKISEGQKLKILQ